MRVAANVNAPPGKPVASAKSVTYSILGITTFFGAAMRLRKENRMKAADDSPKGIWELA